MNIIDAKVLDFLIFSSCMISYRKFAGSYKVNIYPNILSRRAMEACSLPIILVTVTTFYKLDCSQILETDLSEAGD